MQKKLLPDKKTLLALLSHVSIEEHDEVAKIIREAVAEQGDNQRMVLPRDLVGLFAFEFKALLDAGQSEGLSGKELHSQMEVWLDALTPYFEVEFIAEAKKFNQVLQSRVK